MVSDSSPSKGGVIYQKTPKQVEFYRSTYCALRFTTVACLSRGGIASKMWIALDGCSGRLRGHIRALSCNSITQTVYNAPPLRNMLIRFC